VVKGVWEKMGERSLLKWWDTKKKKRYQRKKWKQQMTFSPTQPMSMGALRDRRKRFKRGRLLRRMRKNLRGKPEKILWGVKRRLGGWVVGVNDGRVPKS